MKRILREVLIFGVVLLLLALMQHGDLLSAPGARMALMQEKGNYLHPIYWSAAVYLIIGIVRLVIAGMAKLFKRGKNS